MLLKSDFSGRFEEADYERRTSWPISVSIVATAVWQKHHSKYSPSVSTQRKHQKLDIFDGDARTANFLLRLIGKVLPPLACSHFKVRSYVIGNGAVERACTPSISFIGNILTLAVLIMQSWTSKKTMTCISSMALHIQSSTPSPLQRTVTKDKRLIGSMIVAILRRK